MIEGETRKLRVISDSHPRRFSVCSGKKVLTLYRDYNNKLFFDTSIYFNRGVSEKSFKLTPTYIESVVS